MSKKLKDIFAINMRCLRKKNKLSQEEPGVVGGLHRTCMGAVERSEYNIPIENIEKIAKALDAPLHRGLKKISFNTGYIWELNNTTVFVQGRPPPLTPSLRVLVKRRPQL